MKEISSLLNNIIKKKDLFNDIINIVFDTTKVSISSEDIILNTYRNITYLNLQVSGAKKISLFLKKGELKEKLKSIDIILQE